MFEHFLIVSSMVLLTICAAVLAAYFVEFIHFGLTSQDINNTAIPLSLKEMFDEVYYNSIELILSSLEEISNEWKDIPMIARTHVRRAPSIGKNA